MNAADDADDVIEDVMDDNIKDPIFNMIWENLPIEEKDKILRSSMDIAKDIEGFKDKVEKEKNEQYDEELKNSRQILFNSTDYNEALERHNFILSINGYESDAQRTSAEKLPDDTEKETPVSKKFNKKIYIYSSIIVLVLIIVGYFII